MIFIVYFDIEINQRPNKNINISQSNLKCFVMESTSELGAGPIAPTVIDPLAI